MKILLYSTNYYPEMTGIAKYNTEMAEWLVSKGHEVDVITAMPSYPEWEIYDGYKGKRYVTEIINGVRIYRTSLYVPNKNNTNGLRRLIMQGTFTLNSLRFWFPLYLKKKKYDVMINLCPPLLPQVNSILYKWLKKTPILLHVQDLEFDAALRLGIIKQRFLVKLLNSIEVFFFNKAKAISSITYSMIDRIKEKKININRFIFFPNWSDINFIIPRTKSNKFREMFSEHNGEKIIMYSGNMGKKQGLEMVIEVAEDFKKNKINNIKFIFVGDGVAKESLIEKKDSKQLDNVLFYPIQPLEKLPDLLASADIHLVIQKREAADLVMPSKLTNILSAGRTVIATADQGTALHEVVNNSQSGMAIEPENKDALYDAINDLINRENLLSFEKNARNYAEEFLDKNTILSKFEQDLIRLIEEENN
ncbi:WcaI family glycosyltransferase [Niallia taxi]|uniref:WcaI family glycosyltransferase n=1 Tax=Niallia taxi TaxID=2499688 RepID=UPI00203F656D|nr:WcaI family glycosyltransferase [Niallia taxi]MCM3216403.1 WcaI family glycosyltransferase [Niallia taxi]